MVRSSGFGSITSDICPIQARFHYGSSILCLSDSESATVVLSETSAAANFDDWAQQLVNSPPNSDGSYESRQTYKSHKAGMYTTIFLDCHRNNLHKVANCQPRVPFLLD